MKKRLLITLLSGIMLFGMTGCGTTKNEFEVGEESNIEIAKNNISLSIKEETLKNTGATLILKNDSDVNIHYGNPYEIEIKQDGLWHKINVQLYFTMPAYGLKSKEFKEININWENSYGKLAPGEYRIIKDIDIEREEGTFENFYVAAEFTIK